MVKQVIVVRRDLKMRRGKECAQAAHASMAWLCERVNPAIVLGRSPVFSFVELEWICGSFTKVVVQVKSEEELRAVHERAQIAGLVSKLIVDSGATEFHGIPTPTACAVGPDRAEKIDAVTGGLELY